MPTPTDPGTSTQPVIEFKDVEKRFGDKTVLKDLNFSVERGERVTLIGPSGSGKTTILRLAMTLEHLTDGYIFINGEPLVYEERNGKRVPVSNREQKRLRTRIGMVFQQYNLFPNMTVMENIVRSPILIWVSKRSAESAPANSRRRRTPGRKPTLTPPNFLVVSSSVLLLRAH